MPSARAAPRSGMRAALKARGAGGHRSRARAPAHLHGSPQRAVPVRARRRHAARVVRARRARHHGHRHGVGGRCRRDPHQPVTAALLPSSWLGRAKGDGVLLRRVAGEPVRRHRSDPSSHAESTPTLPASRSSRAPSAGDSTTASTAPSTVAPPWRSCTWVASTQSARAGRRPPWPSGSTAVVQGGGGGRRSLRGQSARHRCRRRRHQAHPHRRCARLGGGRRGPHARRGPGAHRRRGGPAGAGGREHRACVRRRGRGAVAPCLHRDGRRREPVGPSHGQGRRRASWWPARPRSSTRPRRSRPARSSRSS